MSKKYTIDEIEELIKNKPFTLIDKTYVSIRDGITAITDDGYKVIIRWNHVFKNQQPEIFHKRNPYTIENIKQYIKNNRINVELLSSDYICSSDDLVWKCSCGEVFDCSWNSFQQGKHICNKCASVQSGLNNRLSKDYIIESLNEKGLKLLSDNFDLCVTTIRINAIDNDKYKYDFLWSDFSQGKFPQKFHPSNKYTIENINRYLELERDNEYICISNDYKRNTQQLKFKHIKCGCVFDACLVEMQGKYVKDASYKYYKTCPNCNKQKTESTHASVLKQIFKHEYPDTILEDKSCINEKTKRSLPTDIVNHKLKIAIEIQSSYHDSKKQKIIDEYKKNFWKNKGYEFYDPDIRNYSILDLIRLFFPNISEIPDYVDYNFSNCIDANIIQSLLNEGYSLTQISKIRNIKKSALSGMVHQKRISLPKDYKEKVLNRKPVIRLSKNGEFIKRYDNLSRIREDNFAPGTVIRVLKGSQNFSYNSYWVYEEDYINGTYVLPKVKEDNYMLPVNKYSINGKYIKSYDTIYDAENDSKSSKSEIYRVAIGDRKSSRNEKWEFKI